MQDLSWLPSELKNHENLLLCILAPISKVTLKFPIIWYGLYIPLAHKKARRWRFRCG